MSDLLAHLNPPQLAAVTLPPQHALILAGAGSGKTRVLTTRIAWLIATAQVGAHGVLAVTFTNKAAKEMLARLSAQLPINTRGMWIGTFHGLCNRMLRAHHREAGLPAQFQILDSADQLSAIKRLLKNLNVDDAKYPPRELANFINAHKEQGIRAAQAEAYDEYTSRRTALYAEYEAQCQREGVVDFAELLLRSFELLKRNEPLRRHYQERFRHILVDEFQDTNRLQYAWLKLLAGCDTRRHAGIEGMSVEAQNQRSPAAGPSQGRTERGVAAAALYDGTENPVSSSRSDDEDSPPRGEGLGGGAQPSSEGERSPAAGPSQGRTERGVAAAALYDGTESPVSSSRSDDEDSPPRGEGMGGGASIFAVGDDDQSIYAFRGAEVGNMRDFEREFAVANVIRLEQNYRSHGNILDAANALIKNNRGRLGKNLWTDAGAGEAIRVYEALSDLDEARYVVDEVRELSRDGFERTQIALLYRSNAQSRVLEHQLFSAGIAYRVYGGLRFFDRQEVKHALAYLRLIGNPDDDTAFLRVVNFPTRGIGSRSLEALQDAAHRANSSLYNAAASLPGKAGTSIGNFIRLIETLRQESENLALPEIIDRLIEKSGLRAHYLAEKEGGERLENLDELINAATNFVQEEAGSLGENGALASFLAHASLEAGEHQAGEGQDAVQLMTVHAAKGLEFDAVFITGLEQGLFPHENAAQERDGLEEERRLMYVAVTRARRRLYLTHAQTRMLHGQTRYCLPSLFLEELPEELLRKVNRAPAYSAHSVHSAHTPAVSSRPAASTPASSQQRSANGLHVGQNVAHAKFGHGVIVAAEGRGSDARVQVNFGAQGMKWLALEYAKLTPL